MLKSWRCPEIWIKGVEMITLWNSTVSILTILNNSLSSFFFRFPNQDYDNKSILFRDFYNQLPVQIDWDVIFNSGKLYFEFKSDWGDPKSNGNLKSISNRRNWPTIQFIIMWWRIYWFYFDCSPFAQSQRYIDSENW